MEYRIEHDTMGEVKVPVNALYRAQTQRAVENFPISGTTLERAHIAALAQIKKAAAQANAKLGVLDAEIAKAIALGLGRRLIRLQCYEGLDAQSAVAEWNFAAQMIAIRAAEAGQGHAGGKAGLFTEEFLIERPILAAMRPQTGGAPVLLIDELDRADEPFEAFLLEALSDFQVTIPELGTIKAPEPPIVILTSNRTREVHDAIRRRCLYQWVDYPDAVRERAILAAKAPDVPAALSAAVLAGQPIPVL